MPVVPLLRGVTFTSHVAPRARRIVHVAVRFAVVALVEVVHLPRRVAARLASRAMVVTRAAVMA